MKDIETIDTLNQITVDINGDVGSPLWWFSCWFKKKEKRFWLDLFYDRSNCSRCIYP